MSLQHFLLTRFNIASDGREAAIRGRSGWLDRRMDLFEEICLPSVAAQTVHDFKWLIYFDARTDEVYRKRIQNWRMIVPFEALFVDDFVSRRAANDIRKRLSASTEKLLTTRLDNDDAIARFFVAKLHETADQMPIGTALNFPTGYSLRAHKLYHASDPNSPFVSLLEGSDDIKTVWCDQHRKLQRSYPYQQIQSPPAWLQTIHGENVSNRIRGPRVDSPTTLLSFQITEHRLPRPPSVLATKTDRWIWWPMRWVRERAIALAKRTLNR